MPSDADNFFSMTLLLYLFCFVLVFYVFVHFVKKVHLPPPSLFPFAISSTGNNTRWLFNFFFCRKLSLSISWTTCQAPSQSCSLATLKTSSLTLFSKSPNWSTNMQLRFLPPPVLFPLGLNIFKPISITNNKEGICRYHYFTHPVIVLSSPYWIKHVLVENSSNYEKDRDPHLSDIVGNGLLVSQGSLWNKHRRIMVVLMLLISQYNYVSNKWWHFCFIRT